MMKTWRYSGTNEVEITNDEVRSSSAAIIHSVCLFHMFVSCLYISLYVQIIERARLMPVNTEVLEQLEEQFALELISLSETIMRPLQPHPRETVRSTIANLFTPTTPTATTEVWLMRYVRYMSCLSYLNLALSVCSGMERA